MLSSILHLDISDLRVVHKDSINFAARTASNLYHCTSMRTFKGYLHAKFQVPVSMHTEEADKRLVWCDAGFRNCDFSEHNKVFNC